MLQLWSIEFQTNGSYFETRKKSLETRSEAECVKITPVGLKLDRPQLQHWLLFLEHNKFRSKDLNVVAIAGLLVYMDFDCVYDSV